MTTYSYLPSLMVHHTGIQDSSDSFTDVIYKSIKSTEKIKIKNATASVKLCKKWTQKIKFWQFWWVGFRRILFVLQNISSFQMRCLLFIKLKSLTDQIATKHITINEHFGTVQLLFLLMWPEVVFLLLNWKWQWKMQRWSHEEAPICLALSVSLCSCPV